MSDIDTILGITAEQAEFARIITALTAERDALLAFTPKNWRGELSAAIEDTAIKAEKIAKLTTERDALREALEHIGEYWSGSRTDGAMWDALQHIIETVDQALAAPPANGDVG
jgi:hypothetical protein